MNRLGHLGFLRFLGLPGFALDKPGFYGLYAPFALFSLPAKRTP